MVVRCLANCLRGDAVIGKLMTDLKNFQFLLRMVSHIKEDDIVAYCTKCLRFCIKDEDHQLRIVKVMEDQFLNTFIELLPKYNRSESVFNEVTLIIRNYLRKVEYISHIRPRNMGVLINATLECKFPKASQNLVVAL